MKKIIKMIFLKIFFILGAAYLSILFIAYFFADKIAFPAPKASYSFSFSKDLVSFQTASGEKLCGLWLPNEDAQYTILYSHGNGEDLGEIADTLYKLKAQGFSVLGYDYCGYGQSEGAPSSAMIPLCADAAWDFLAKEKNIASENIVIYGYSMGSAASSYLAANKNPRALVLLCGFAKAICAILPVDVLPWDFLNNEKFISQIKCPVLIVHGNKDVVVNVRNAKRLHAAANSKKYMAIVDGAGHYNIPKLAPKIYYHGIRDFINSLEFDEENYKNLD